MKYKMKYKIFKSIDKVLRYGIGIEFDKFKDNNVIHIKFLKYVLTIVILKMD